MPNWCNNEITINGRKKVIDKIKSLIDNIPSSDDSNGLFNALIGRNEKEFNEDWYNHNINRYGCKWDVSIDDVVREDSDTEIRLSFSTAWSPCVEFCRTLSNFHGDLEINLLYDEGGNDFAGEVFFRSGSILSIKEYNYLEGLYFLRKESFWSDIEYYVENAIDDGESFDDFIKDKSFISEKDKKDIIEMFNEKQNA